MDLRPHRSAGEGALLACSQHRSVRAPSWTPLRAATALVRTFAVRRPTLVRPSLLWYQTQSVRQHLVPLSRQRTPPHLDLHVVPRTLRALFVIIRTSQRQCLVVPLSAHAPLRSTVQLREIGCWLLVLLAVVAAAPAPAAARTRESSQLWHQRPSSSQFCLTAGPVCAAPSGGAASATTGSGAVQFGTRSRPCGIRQEGSQPVTLCD